MGMMDKFLNAMRLNSDEEDYLDEEDDFYDDEEDEYVPPKRNSRRERDRRESERAETDSSVSRETRAAAKTSASSAKITPMRSSRRSQGGAAAMEVCVVKPSSIEDTREITDTLLAGRTVVLNLEGLDLEIGQRIIDFTSGSCYAISGNLQKISNYIFIVTPQNVDISGDFQNIMSAFDVSSLSVDI